MLKKNSNYAQYFIENNKNKNTIKQIKIILKKLND